MYPSLWGGFPRFNVHEDRQGAYYSCCSVFVACPTERTSVAQGLFLVGQCTGPELTCARMAKNTFSPVSIPPIRAYLRRQAINPTPTHTHLRIKDMRDGPLRLEEISSYRDILGQIRAAASTDGRSATQQLERCSAITAAALALPA